MKKEIRISEPELNRKKAREVILYLLNRCGAISEKKLKLLLYFIDFDFFEKYEERIMGFKYMKMKDN